MKIYSIVRIDDDYVVQAGQKSILKVASRRRAARLVLDAAELLDLQAAVPEAQTGIDRPLSPPSCAIPTVLHDPPGLLPEAMAESDEVS